MRVHLNGGPWHDRMVSVEDNHDHFHIVEPNPSYLAALRLGEAPPDGEELANREGMYSQVGRLSTPLKGEFEWDGWVSHD